MTRPISRRQLLALLVTLAGASLLVLLLLSGGDTKQRVFLFVIDERSDKSSPLESENLATGATSNPRQVQVIVRTFIPAQFVDSQAAMARAAELVQKAIPASTSAPIGNNAGVKNSELPESELLFIELDSPYGHTQKALRSRFDEQKQLTQAARVWLLDRVVPVVRVGPYVWPDGCQEMKDDFTYAQWTFRGVGLHLDESAIQLLKSCKPF